MPAGRVSDWSRRLGAALVSAGAVSESDVDDGLTEAGTTGRTLGEVLVARDRIVPAEALTTLAKLSNVPVVDLFTELPSAEAIAMVPAAIAREFRCVGYKVESGMLHVATVEPLTMDDLNTLSGMLGSEVRCVLGDPAAIEKVMQVAYQSTDSSPVAAVSAVVDQVNASPPGSAGAPVPAAPPPPPMSFTATAMAPPPPAPPPPAGQPATAPPAPVPVAQVAAPPPPPVSFTAATAAPSVPAPPPISAAPPPPAPAPAPVPAPAPAAAPPPPPPPPAKTTVPLMKDVNELLVYAVEHGSSDLHLTNRIPPSIRVDGSIRPIQGQPPLDNETIREMIYGIITQGLRERFEANKELDTSHSIMGVGRFRVNVFQQRGSIGAVLRTIPHDIPSFESLGLPDSVKSVTELRRGLVLVTGPTGSGKSTTLASLVSIINQTRPLHIITVEDPIEFLHNHGRCIVNQREVGADTKSFAEALKHVLRQDPDVILVGEMRDLETISTALTAAETGHLVFATLHTQDAPQTVDRVIDVFPVNQQAQVRVMLAGSLEAVVTQQLVVTASGVGRVAIAEVMIATPAIRNLVRSAKTHQIYSLMQTGAAQGMQTMDQALAKAVKAGTISEGVAYDRCHDEAELRDYLKGNV